MVINNYDDAKLLVSKYSLKVWSLRWNVLLNQWMQNFAQLYLSRVSGAVSMCTTIV